MEGFNVDELKQRLLDADSFVMSLIDTIPPKLYFDEEIQGKLAAEKHAIMDKKASELKRKRGKQEMSSKSKHKRARLDPEQHKSVSQIQQQLMAKEKKKSKNFPFSSETITRAANIEDLQMRIQERLKKFQEKRKSCTGAEFLKKKRSKNKGKNERKRQKMNAQKAALKDKPSIPAAKKPLKKPEAPKKLYNSEGKIIYSKFDFTDDSSMANQKGIGKNYKKLLQKAESKQEKLDHLRQEDKQKADVVEQKTAWQRVIQKAEGVKLKDDPKLLKKSLKMQEKKKLKSAKQWNARLDHAEKTKKNRQEKRTRNIQHKKDNKKDKKLKLAKKKGRVIPGF